MSRSTKQQTNARIFKKLKKYINKIRFKFRQEEEYHVIRKWLNSDAGNKNRKRHSEKDLHGPTYVEESFRLHGDPSDGPVDQFKFPKDLNNGGKNIYNYLYSSPLKNEREQEGNSKRAIGSRCNGLTVADMSSHQMIAEQIDGRLVISMKKLTEEELMDRSCLLQEMKDSIIWRETSRQQTPSARSNTCSTNNKILPAPPQPPPPPQVINELSNYLDTTLQTLQQTTSPETLQWLLEEWHYNNLFKA